MQIVSCWKKMNVTSTSVLCGKKKKNVSECRLLINKRNHKWLQQTTFTNNLFNIFHRKKSFSDFYWYLCEIFCQQEKFTWNVKILFFFFFFCYDNLNQMKVVCYKLCFALYQHPASDILKYFQTTVLTVHALHLDSSCLISSSVEKLFFSSEI